MNSEGKWSILEKFIVKLWKSRRTITEVVKPQGTLSERAKNCRLRTYLVNYKPTRKYVEITALRLSNQSLLFPLREEEPR